MKTGTEYDLLIEKLTEFRKKYYLNILLKGSLLFVAIISSLFLLLTFTEFNIYFNSGIRTTFFFLFLIIACSVFLFWIARPALKMFNIGTSLTFEDASFIIGKYFPEVSDKLINVLQLKSNETALSQSLIEASINQKIESFKAVRFVQAIPFKRNRKFLKYAIAPLVVILLLLSFRPEVITQSTQRLVQFNKEFSKPLPYEIVIENKELKAVENEDFSLRVIAKGEEIPAEILVKTNETEYLMRKEEKNTFVYQFKKVKQDVKFRLATDEYTSNEYNLDVISKPTLLNYTLSLLYPAYIGKINETLENSGDITIPEGTQVSWLLRTKQTKSIFFKLGNSTYHLTPSSNNQSSFKTTVKTPTRYGFVLSNADFKQGDSISFSIQVVRDEFPTISLKQFRDSINPFKYYFIGDISDDYGFSNLSFYVAQKNGKGTTDVKKAIPIFIDKKRNAQNFYYMFDFSELNYKEEEDLDYYFAVSDNDQVNGAKTTRSQAFTLEAPTTEKIAENLDKSDEKIEDKLKDNLKDTRKLQKEIDQLSKKLLDKKDINWQDKKQLNDLMQKQKEIKSEVEEIKKQLDINQQLRENFTKTDERIVEKQKQLEKLFEELLNDDMRKLMEEIQNLMQMNNNLDMKKNLDQLKLKSEDLEKTLDRNLELFKQLEVENKLNQAINKLDNLTQEQKELTEKTKSSSENPGNLEERQRKLDDKFNELRKDLNELQQKNKELESPMDFKRDQEKENNISKEMKNAAQELQKNKKGSAGKHQQEAQKQMEEMQNQLEQMQEDMQDEQTGEDMEMIKKLMGNLVRASFQQEKLMNQTRETTVKNPKYQEIINDQKRIKEGMLLLEDSLFAISKRQIQIQPIINKEINAINSNLEQVMNDLLALNTVNYFGLVQNQTPASRQQYVMTSMNNLALLLNESLNNMQQQQSQKKKSGKNKSNCKNPGSSQNKQSGQPKNMRQMQEALNKQLEQLKDGLKKMNKPGQSQSSGSNFSEQFARAAAQQEAIRKMMQKYAEEMKKKGMGSQGELNEMMREMEKTEQELVNKILSTETLNRQQKILTRLLEHEKAKQKQEQEERRESREAKEKPYAIPAELLDLKKKFSRENEMIRTYPPGLSPFYKRKANKYFQQIQ